MERGKCCQHIDEDVGADDDAADGWIFLTACVAAPKGQMGCRGADEVGWKHEQGLADAVPGVETAATTVKSELGIFVGKDLRLACPERVSYLQAMGGVGGAEF